MHEMIFWGILCSLAFTELAGISPGGVIVPAYLLLYWQDPARIALTLGLALACIGIVRLLSRWMILYGRRRYAVYLLTGILLKMLFALAYAKSPVPIPNLSLSIGYLIPGLLGQTSERQGVVRTFLALGIVVCILKILQIGLMG